MTDRFRRTYPEATQKVVNGFVRTAQWLADEKNRDEAFQIWSRAGTPVATIARSSEGSALKEKYNPRLDEFFRTRYASAIAFNKEQKLIRRDVDLNARVDASYVNKAITDLNLENFWADRGTTGAVQN